MTEKSDISPLRRSIANGIRLLTSRRIFLLAMLLLPVVSCLFFISLLNEGLPVRVPTAVVDNDHSELSREMVCNLGASQLVNVTVKAESYGHAMNLVRNGEVFGFYVIPANFQKDAIAGRKPVVTYYPNMSYFVPGTFSYKGYKSIAVSSAASMISGTATSMGLRPGAVSALVQPVNFDVHPVHNPSPNYSVYLTPSFLFGVIELMIFMVTVFTLTGYVKRGTARRWLADAGGNIVTAVFGTLLPQTVIWVVVTWFSQAMMYSVGGFVLYCPLWQILLSSLLFVLACQAFGITVAALLPNPRFSLSICALTGILAFSLAGFSFPVEDMYGAVGIFSYILPVRYMFLIHANTALNGFAMYFVRGSLLALLLFPAIATLSLPLLRRNLTRAAYVP